MILNFDYFLCSLSLVGFPAMIHRTVVHMNERRNYCEAIRLFHGMFRLLSTRSASERLPTSQYETGDERKLILMCYFVSVRDPAKCADNERSTDSSRHLRRGAGKSIFWPDDKFHVFFVFVVQFSATAQKTCAAKAKHFFVDNFKCFLSIISGACEGEAGRRQERGDHKKIDNDEALLAAKRKQIN